MAQENLDELHRRVARAAQYRDFDHSQGPLSVVSCAWEKPDDPINSLYIDRGFMTTDN